MKTYFLFSIFLFSLSLTSLFVFLTPSVTHGKASNQVRRWLERSDAKKICDKSPPSIKEYFSGISNQLENNPIEMKAEPSNFLLTYISTGKLDNTIGYLMRFLPFLVFIVGAVLSVIGWIACCCCCLCPFCCCKQANKTEFCCRFCSFIFTLAMFSVVGVMSLYGVISIQNIMRGFNGTTCTIMELFFTWVEGQITNDKPKWDGIVGLQKFLNDTTSVIANISSNVNDAFKDKTLLNNAKVDYELKLNKSYEDIYQKKIVYSTNLSYQPTYIEQFGPWNKSESFLDLINTEHSSIVDSFMNIINEVETNSQSINTGSQELIPLLDSVSETLDTVQDTFYDWNEKYITLWNKYQEYVITYGTLAFYALFGVYLGFSIIIVVLVLWIVLCKSNCVKLIVHIVWNVLVLIMIVSMILGALFGIIGIIGGDVSDVAISLISQQNLNSQNPILIPSEFSSYLTICLHGDGDLSAELNLQTDSTDSWNNLAEMNKTLQSIKKELPEESWSIQEISVKLQDYKYNYLLSSSEYNPPTPTPTPNQLLKNLNEEIEKCISTNIDLWVTNKTNCPNDKIYYENNNAFPGLDKGWCWVTSEWNNSIIKNRYEECSTEVMVGYFDQLTTIYQEDTKLLDEMDGNLNQFNEDFNKTLSLIRKNIENVGAIIDPISQIFNTYLGTSNSIFSILNCKFLGDNINLLLRQLQQTWGNNFYTIGIIIETIASCSAGGIICLIIVLNRYNKITPDIQKEIEEKKRKEHAAKFQNNDLNKNETQNPKSNINWNNPEMIAIKNKVRSNNSKNNNFA